MFRFAPRVSKTALALALTIAGVSVHSADYYIVTPIVGRTAMADEVSVTLNASTLPAGVMGLAYDRFALDSLLSVTGDPSYTGAGVQWLVTAGSLPAGLVLNADGSLSGKPTVTGDFPFTLQASYRGKAASQSYTLTVKPVYVVAQSGGVRTWADGTVAASCLEYRTGKRGYEYSGATGDGVYQVQPLGGQSMAVYCDMTTEGGGWTLLMKQAKNDGVTLQGDTAYWTAGTTLNDTLSNLNMADANLVSKAYSKLVVTQLRLQASNESTFKYQTVSAMTPLVAFGAANVKHYHDDVGSPGTVAYPNWFIRSQTYPNGAVITTARFGFNVMLGYVSLTDNRCGARWGWAANQDVTGSIYVGSHDVCGGLGAYGSMYGTAWMRDKNGLQPATLYLWGK